MTNNDARRAIRYLENAIRNLALANAISTNEQVTASITAAIKANLLQPLIESHAVSSTAETSMAPVPKSYSQRIVETCHQAGDLLVGLLQDAPPSAQADMQVRVGEVLAYTSDFLIIPAIGQHPAINPYRP